MKNNYKRTVDPETSFFENILIDLVFYYILKQQDNDITNYSEELVDEIYSHLCDSALGFSNYYSRNSPHLCSLLENLNYIEFTITDYENTSKTKTRTRYRPFSKTEIISSYSVDSGGMPHTFKFYFSDWLIEHLKT